VRSSWCPKARQFDSNGQGCRFTIAAIKQLTDGGNAHGLAPCLQCHSRKFFDGSRCVLPGQLAQLSDDLGRPPGLPDCPGSKGRPLGCALIAVLRCSQRAFPLRHRGQNAHFSGPRTPRFHPRRGVVPYPNQPGLFSWAETGGRVREIHRAGRVRARSDFCPAHFTISPHKFHALAESWGQNGKMAWGNGDVFRSRYPGHQSRLYAPPLSTGAALHARPGAEVVGASRPISPFE
jgi:hypothetical protein